MDPTEVEVDDDMVNTLAAVAAMMPEGEGSSSELGLIIAGAAAALVSIIYSMKHIKKSSCWGVKCDQEVVDAVHDPVVVVCPDGRDGRVMAKETDV